MKKRIYHFATILLISIMILGSQTALAAGCGKFTIYRSSEPKCSREHCGIWDTTAWVQILYKRRFCVNDNNRSYWDYSTERIHADCGCSI